ncbi:hypothetical protein DICVIV_09782 [Dictyocaulus viviparus]|uniref:Uncharacterized protein n=1 Tax=Dictyocaulus viviparus TaxID=29172 RepID=A0A0D8XPA3_DICVI|nr:hypothetical protein DICVIV_09782 [Dictyocaulus viviparus]
MSSYVSTNTNDLRMASVGESHAHRRCSVFTKNKLKLNMLNAESGANAHSSCSFDRRYIDQHADGSLSTSSSSLDLQSCRFCHSRFSFNLQQTRTIGDH